MQNSPVRESLNNESEAPLKKRNQVISSTSSSSEIKDGDQESGENNGSKNPVPEFLDAMSRRRVIIATGAYKSSYSYAPVAMATSTESFQPASSLLLTHKRIRETGIYEKSPSIPVKAMPKAKKLLLKRIQQYFDRL
jgi:hypothetical protein